MASSYGANVLSFIQFIGEGRGGGGEWFRKTANYNVAPRASVPKGDPGSATGKHGPTFLCSLITFFFIAFRLFF